MPIGILRIALRLLGAKCLANALRMLGARLLMLILLQELNFGFHSPSLRAKRSNPVFQALTYQSFYDLCLDCFASSFLAMTKKGLFAVESTLCKCPANTSAFCNHSRKSGKRQRGCVVSQGNLCPISAQSLPLSNARVLAQREALRQTRIFHMRGHCRYREKKRDGQARPAQPQNHIGAP
jgi:hypothetical protein